MNNNGFGYVDLGLPSGTLWATCNVGANSPIEYGKYFAWGETDGYYDNQEHYFDWGDYKYGYNDGSKFTKYNNRRKYGIVDSKLELELIDDAAHVNMGVVWKMPTTEQIDELVNKTENEWVDDYQGTGVAGQVFISMKYDNTMFIPASGYRLNTSVYGQGAIVGLWTSTLDDDDPLFGFLGDFNSHNFNLGSIGRYYGYCVRGVLNKK